MTVTHGVPADVEHPAHVAPPRRHRWFPVPGMWGRTLLAALAIVVAFLILWGPLLGLIGGLVDRMAVSVPIVEPDVNELVLRLSVDDAPLEFGSRDAGPDGPVDAMQRMLALLGFDPGAADGVYGGGTEEAVRAFQQSQVGLEATGVADEVTITVLLRVFSGSEAAEIDIDQLLEDFPTTEVGGEGSVGTAPGQVGTTAVTTPPAEGQDGTVADPGFDDGVVEDTIVEDSIPDSPGGGDIQQVPNEG